MSGYPDGFEPLRPGATAGFEPSRPGSGPFEDPFHTTRDRTLARGQIMRERDGWEEFHRKRAARRRPQVANGTASPTPDRRHPRLNTPHHEMR